LRFQQLPKTAIPHRAPLTETARCDLAHFLYALKLTYLLAYLFTQNPGYWPAFRGVATWCTGWICPPWPLPHGTILKLMG